MGFYIFLAVFCLLNFPHFNNAHPKHNPSKSDKNTLETYIVQVESNPQVADSDSFYDSFLPSSSTESETEAPKMIYRYREVLSGFAAKLSAKHVEAMKKKKGFISARKERVFPLLTTHSPNFLGLTQNAGFWKAANYGKGVIIGVLDTGITPDHPSFSGEGIPAPPQKWKGTCGLKSGKRCNNKLIGAKAFDDGTDPAVDPIDKLGHGTHTASTAAGNYVKDADYFGLANGTASGVAPLAHLAIYKVCGVNGCTESSIVAGLDSAVSEGVDIISMSLGSSPRPIYADPIAIGAFAAIQKGIFVSCAAGNSGPFDGTVSNDAPWILTVGASTHDRALEVSVVLGDNTVLRGQTAFQPTGSSTANLELAFPKRVNCMDLSDGKYNGTVVVCQEGGYRTEVQKGDYVKYVGGAGMLLVDLEETGAVTSALPHVLPAAEITYQDGKKVSSYAKSATKPTVSFVFKGTQIGDKNAPIVAPFSSRGPSTITPGVLKPDILGPGVDILAAWHTPIENSTTKPAFNMASGTSVSAPHLSGVAALIKSVHPDWSPAAIKSAIVTTAQTLNLDNKPILDATLLPADAYSTGAGQVNPTLASDPGLVYDLKPEDYIPYLCGLNYSNEQVGTIVRQKVDCAKVPKIPQSHLNYPSFSISFERSSSSSQTYTRTVTNVGPASSVYEVKTESPQGVTIKVYPAKLTFTKVGEQQSYNVTFTKSSGTPKDTYGRGSITWTAAKNIVRSPVGFIF